MFIDIFNKRKVAVLEETIKKLEIEKSLLCNEKLDPWLDSYRTKIYLNTLWIDILEKSIPSEKVAELRTYYNDLINLKCSEGKELRWG